jgi:hypothetical protein
LLLIGCVSLDWRFFAASVLASLAIIAVGVKAAGIERAQSIRQRPLKKPRDDTRDASLAPWQAEDKVCEIGSLTQIGQISLLCLAGCDYS